MQKIGFSGSFDPLTKGHLWVIEEALNIADEVIVFLAINGSKTPKFTLEERVAMIEKSTNHLNGRVKVITVKSEYVAQVAKENYGCDYLIRGIRNAGDFDYESLIQQTNRDVLGGAKTIFVFPPRDLDSVSSSFVKSLVGPVGWHYYVEDFLPKAVIEYWIQKELNAIKAEILKVDDSKSMSFGVHSGNENMLNKILNDLASMYEDENRHYHDKGHLLYMLQLALHHKKITMKEVSAMDLLQAIFAHDCIMKDESDVSAEELSARHFEGLGVPLINADSIAQAIRATEYLSNPDVAGYLTLNPIAKVLVSLDLAILGSNKAVYDKYKAKVRMEYSHVSPISYIQGREMALTKLIEMAKKGNLISLAGFEEINKKAIQNMTDEMNSLR